MTSYEPEPKPRPYKRAADGVMAVWKWLQGRKTARSIARHGQAITALTAVAAAGTAGFGVVEARQAQHSVADLTAQMQALAIDTALVQAAIIGVQADVRALDTRSAKALNALKHDMVATAIEMDNLAARVAALPPTPNLAPVAARISRVAATAREAAREAAAATAAAAEQHDPEARAAAEGAAEAAGLAAAAARAAQAKADEAKAKADAIVVPPAYEPFPRVITLPDFTDPPGAGGQSRTFTVDLPKGDYKATLTLHGEGVQPWYVDFSTTGVAAPRFNATGSADAEAQLSLTTGGGTQTFTVKRDGFNPNTPAVFTSTTITIEEL